MKKKNILNGLVILAVGLAAGWYLFIGKSSPDGRFEETAVVSAPVEQSVQRTVSPPDQQAPQPVPLKEKPQVAAAVVSSPSPEKNSSSNVPAKKPPLVVPADKLTAMLPQWMQEKGDLLTDSRLVNGVPVTRSRGRYAWENGSSMEVEISDAGADAPDEVLASLGFNLQMTNRVDETGFTTVVDKDGMLMNYEYHYGDAAGSVQLILSNRFLVEIQLQQLPAESFQQIIDQQLSLSELMSIRGTPSL